MQGISLRHPNKQGERNYTYKLHSYKVNYKLQIHGKIIEENNNVYHRARQEKKNLYPNANKCSYLVCIYRDIALISY